MEDQTGMQPAAPQAAPAVPVVKQVKELLSQDKIKEKFAVQGFLRYIWENALRIYCNGKAEWKMGRAEIEGPHGWKLCRFLL